DQGIDPMQADIEGHYQWIDTVAKSASTGGPDQVLIPTNHESPATSHVLDYPHATRTHLSDRLDKIFLHRVWGVLAFAAIMATLFIAIFYIADPLMGATEEAIGWLGGLVTDLLPDGPVRDLWTDGIVAGVGGVVVFVPQIAMLFLFIAILEDTGYLARAAFLMDRLLGKLGLNGKSFIPLLSSHACAIPGIMAARTIENRMDRMATIFVAPFMSCSARLPVYALLIGAFFASYSSVVQGGILFACYALGILAAVGTALVFRKTFMKGAATSFVLELPTYKVPQITQVIRVMANNTWMFVRRAGTIIFALSIILWAMAYYPRLDPAKEQELRASVATQVSPAPVAPVEPLPDGGPIGEPAATAASGGAETTTAEASADPAAEASAAAQLEQSYSGRLGHFIEPVIRPLGYDWKMGVGLIASFAAREVFVSQMGIVYSAGDAEDDPAPLEEAMKADTNDSGAPVWTAPVAISLLVWFVLAMQCMSTVAVVRRETGTWTWPIAQLVYMNVLAYVCAFTAYQIALRVFA
ncbi:MAG TPA: ferrous iron transporter B, partial [Tepidisphaeraceae bacterium]